MGTSRNPSCFFESKTTSYHGITEIFKRSATGRYATWLLYLQYEKKMTLFRCIALNRLQQQCKLLYFKKVPNLSDHWNREKPAGQLRLSITVIFHILTRKSLMTRPFLSCWMIYRKSSMHRIVASRVKPLGKRDHVRQPGEDPKKTKQAWPGPFYHGLKLFKIPLGLKWFFGTNQQISSSPKNL